MKPSEGFASYLASLHRAVHALGLYFEASLDGITQAEAIVLLFLATTQSPTINELHRAFLHRRSTLTSVLDRLERRGYVTREMHTGDRRSLRLGLTAPGRKAADAVAASLAELESEVGASAARMSAASRLLEQTATSAAEAVDGV